MAIINTVNFRILLSVILVSPLVVLIGIFLSHRIAGPIYRMEKFMESIGAGDLSGKLVLREGDELISLADGINSLVSGLKSAVMCEKGLMDKITKEAEHLKSIVISRPQDAGAIKDAVSKLESDVKELGKCMDRYKL